MSRRPFAPRSAMTSEGPVSERPSLRIDDVYENVLFFIYERTLSSGAMVNPITV